MKLYFVVFFMGCVAPLSYADSDVALELLAGRSEHRLDISTVLQLYGKDAPSTYSDTAHSDVFGVRFGYQVFRYVAVDVAHLQHGEPEHHVDDSISNLINSSSNRLGFKVAYPLTERLAVTGRVGVAFWELDIRGKDSSDPDLVLRVARDGEDAYYSAGLEYAISKRLVAGLEYSTVTMSWKNSDPVGNSYASSAKYRVGSFAFVLSARY